MSQHTYAETAADWDLWNEYVNTDAAMDRAEFDALTTEQKVKLQIAAFGPEPQLTIVGEFEHLAGTDVGRAAVEEYLASVEAGVSHTEAEILASDLLQRAGFNVNARGGVSIGRAE